MIEFLYELPIEMVSYTDNKGSIRPIRFRMQVEEESMQVIKIDKVSVKETEKLAGNIMIVFKCKSLIDKVIRLFEIRYEISTCKWILFKI